MARQRSGGLVLRPLWHDSPSTITQRRNRARLSHAGNTEVRRRRPRTNTDAAVLRVPLSVLGLVAELHVADSVEPGTEVDFAPVGEEAYGLG